MHIHWFICKFFIEDLTMDAIIMAILFDDILCYW